MIKKQLIDAGMTNLPEYLIELDTIPPGPILTTKCLNEFLAAWKAKVDLQTSQERRHNGAKARHCLEFAGGWAEVMCLYWNGSFALEDPIPIEGYLSQRGRQTDQAMILSIFILVETLRDAFPYIFNDNYRRILDYHPNQPEILVRRFKTSRWCPNRIRWALSVGFGPAYVLSSGSMEGVRVGHEECTDDGCVINNIDDATYEASHSLHCSYRYKEPEKCPFISSDSMQSMSKIIEAGGIPVVHFDGTKIEVVPVSEGKPAFTALSHVWSEGLGSNRSRGNALPECQVQRLQHLVDNLERIRNDQNSAEVDASSSTRSSEDPNTSWASPITNTESQFEWVPYPSPRQYTQLVSSRNFFWIDTLCIPVTPPHLRRAAIRRIGEVFQKAARVVVMDEGLERSNAPGVPSMATVLPIGVAGTFEFSLATSLEGLLVQLACSAWMCRCWTFAEGVLASELYIALSGGFMNYDKILWRFVSERESKLAGNGLGRLVDGLMNARRLQPTVRSQFSFQDGLQLNSNIPAELEFPSETSAKSYQRTLDTLIPVMLRTTTKAEDETICIASALGLELKEIQAHKTVADRMVQLLLSLEFIPAEILYLANPKMQHPPGFSWAPVSFLNGGTTSEIARIPVARVTDGGLLHQARAYIFQAFLPELHLEGFAFKTRSGTQNLVNHVQRRTHEPWDASKQFTHADKEFLEGMMERLIVQDHGRIDAIIENSLYTQFVLFTASKTLGSQPRSVGALARICTADPGTSHLATALEELELNKPDACPIVGTPTEAQRNTNLGQVASVETQQQGRGGFQKAKITHPSARQAITVKYEYPVTIATKTEQEFGIAFDFVQDQPNRGFLDFVFIADETPEDQLWRII